MAADGDITALIGAFVEEEIEERAEAQATAEAAAAAVTASPPAAAAAGATAAEGGSAKQPRGAKKMKKSHKAKEAARGAAVPADADLATLPTQEHAPPAVGDGGGDDASAVDSVAAPEKNTTKKKQETEDQSGAQDKRRISARALGTAPPDEEGLGELASKARMANKAAKKGQGAAGSAAAIALADMATGAGGSSAGGGGEEEDPRWTPKVKVRKENKAKSGHKNRANEKHASGVWDTYSPTGIFLGEQFCKDTFEHSDGKAWARKVYNPKVDFAPKKLRDGEYYPTTKDKLRPYEREPRSIVFVPRIAPADKVNFVNIDPNERMYPTEHQQDASRFLGTLLSSVGVVWFTEDDNKSKSSYADWAGSIKELEYPEHGVHKYFSDIVPGYYVKMDSSDTKKYAVLYVYRPFKSLDLEPEIMVLEIDAEEKFVDGKGLQSIKCEQIIEVGGGNNSLCKRVVQWLKDNMGQFFNGCTMASATEDGEVDPAHVVEHMLGILDHKTIVKNYKEMSRKLADTYELADKTQHFMGVRKGRMDWIEITKKSKDPKVPDETERQQTGVFTEVTDYDMWYNRQVLRSVEILQCTTEFAGLHKSGQDSAFAEVNELTELLTQHEEDLLKHINGLNWQTGRIPHVYRYFDDPYHKLDANGHIRKPVHVPYMLSYSFLSRVSETTATMKDKYEKALHTELTVWTSKHARSAFHSHIKSLIEKPKKPEWLEDECKARDKCMTDEAKKARKAQNRNKAGAENAGEPDGDTDDDIATVKPKKKAAKARVWDPMNRRVGEDTPRGHVDKDGTDFDGCKAEDRKVGVVACFMNSTNKRKNKHLWCVCDLAPEGHWNSTQGQPQVHPNALMDGYAISSAKKKYSTEGKAAAEAKKVAKRKPAAGSSSTGSTLAEADLRIAKANINDLQKQLAEVVSQRDDLHLQLHKSMDLGNQQLTIAARTANETAHAHARQLRTTKATTAEAIGKMKAMRQHAHGFAELMLPYAVREQAPDHFSCWASFSGLLDDAQIKEAFDKPKSKSASSAAVYNIDEFNSFAGPAAMNSPAPNVPYNLTVAKVKASERPADYEALEPVDPAKATFMGKGKGAAKKRARDDDGDDDGDDDDDDDEDMDTNDDDVFV